MLRAILFFSVMLLSQGCVHRECRYIDDGVQLPPPRVALLEIKNSTDCAVPWSLSEELSLGVYAACGSLPHIYWQTAQQVNFTYKDWYSCDPFGYNLACVADRFPYSDFVVAIELLEHSSVPIAKGCLSPAFPAQANRCNTVLQMRARLRIIDLRGIEPRILRQEIVNGDYFIPEEAARVDYWKLRWGTALFADTPWGHAHRRLVDQLSRRIQRHIATQM
jgi:hypothetical protein